MCALTGCAQDDKDANARLESETRAMIDALLSGDEQVLYDLLEEGNERKLAIDARKKER